MTVKSIYHLEIRISGKVGKMMMMMTVTMRISITILVILKGMRMKILPPMMKQRNSRKFLSSRSMISLMILVLSSTSKVKIDIFVT